MAGNDGDLLGIDIQRRKIDRSGFHPAAGRDCPWHCALGEPAEQLARSRQPADTDGVSLVGLGMTPPQPLDPFGINFERVSRNS
jgi:hypothetical protein